MSAWEYIVVILGALLVIVGIALIAISRQAITCHAATYYSEPCLRTTGTPCPRSKPAAPCVFPPGGVWR